MVTNANFPTDNDLEIPVLPLSAQAKFIDRPVAPWGGHSKPKHWRPCRGPGGVLCFYVEDARFSHLVENPHGAWRVPAPVFCELNFSLERETPVWRAIELTAKKRLFSRLAASPEYGGKELLVDLNVPSEWDELNLTGVPAGWRSYSTRASDHDVAGLAHRHGVAIRHYEAGGNEYRPGDLVFLVYGGGPRVMEYCREHHLEYAELDVARYHRHRTKAARGVARGVAAN